MTFLSKFATALLLTASISAPAMAADLDAPIDATEYDWSGGYIGLQAGGFLSRNATATGFLNGAQIGVPFTDSANSFIGGIMTGYNFQKGKFVFGIDNDVSVSTARYAFGPNNHRLRTLSTARVRVGYAFDRVLPYVTGGLAYSFTRLDPLAPLRDRTGIDVGWTVGAGVEAAVTDNIRARLQYNYVDLGNRTFNNLGTPTFAIRSNIDGHIIRAGVAIRTKAIFGLFKK